VGQGDTAQSLRGEMTSPERGKSVEKTVPAAKIEKEFGILLASAGREKNWPKEGRMTP